jgi:hypothetical protein
VALRPGSRVFRKGRHCPRGRALRLAAAIGTIVGGLSIVLGTLALVVELGPRQPGKPRPAAGAVLTYSWHRTQRPRKIEIPGPGLYSVAWSFRCRPGRTGGFKMADTQAAATANAEVTDSGPRGQGNWLDDRTGRRSLYVAADCNWQAIVRPVTRAPAAPQQGNGGHHGAPVPYPHHEHQGYDKHLHENNPHGHGRENPPGRRACITRAWPIPRELTDQGNWTPAKRCRADDQSKMGGASRLRLSS